MAKVGRKPKYSSDQQLQDKFLSYLKRCGKSKLPNKAGLCAFMKISRDTYSEYRKQFPDTIKEMDNVIEDRWVQRLGGGYPTGAIFYLKNAFKNIYKDKHEQTLTVKSPQPILGGASRTGAIEEKKKK